MPNTKRFEDWYEVDCNECSHYWDNSCDGACKGSQKPCNSFLATRSVVIPAQIKSLKSQLRWLYGAFFVETVLLFLLIGVGFFG